VNPLNPVDAARILLSLVMLGYTSWIDLRTREIYDLVWVVFGALGLILAAYEIYIGALTIMGLVVPVVFSSVLSILLGYLGLFGGADVEAFIALALLNPFPPRHLEPILGMVSVIYPLTLFSNSALAGASFAVVLLARNLALALGGKRLFENHGADPLLKKLVVMFTGRRVSLESVRGPPFQYPLEHPPEEGGSGWRLVLMPDINDDDAAWETFRRLEGEGIRETWVSHTLPFLVFITVGYLMTLVLGDVALTVLSSLILG
jgi:preflagellin peptidase FlaK